MNCVSLSNDSNCLLLSRPPNNIFYSAQIHSWVAAMGSTNSVSYRSILFVFFSYMFWSCLSGPLNNIIIYLGSRYIAPSDQHNLKDIVLESEFPSIKNNLLCSTWSISFSSLIKTLVVGSILVFLSHCPCFPAPMFLVCIKAYSSSTCSCLCQGCHDLI